MVRVSIACIFKIARIKSKSSTDMKNTGLKQPNVSLDEKTHKKTFEFCSVCCYPIAHLAAPAQTI
jgi:hypothetical protein